MLDSPLPRHADLRKLVSRQAGLAGRVELAEIPRIADLLMAPDACVAVELRGTRDDEGRRLVAGSVRCSLALQCQRCLEPVPVEVEQDFALALLWSETEVEQLPRHYDPLVVGEEATDLWELVCEEVLLGLPIVARHESGACSARAGDGSEFAEAAEGKENPFNVLEALKKEH